MEINYVAIGQKIKMIRKKKTLTQSTLSEMINRSPTYVSYIESGIKSMSLDTFVQIANALNSSADELLQDSLENTIKVSNHAFASLLSDCSEYEKRVLLDVIASTKQSLRSNRAFFRYPR